ncbi:MAG: AAA-like domain-containing protein [Cyanobacteria bacterium J06623_7]
MSDLEISQVLRIIGQIIEPEKLNAVQELVLRQCWLGKTYQEIAQDSQYDSDYVRVVGSKVWQSLSLAFEAKITKHNFKSVLESQVHRGKLALHTLEFPQGQVSPSSYFYVERPPCEEKAFVEILNPGALVVIKSPLNMGKSSLLSRTLAQVRAQQYYTVTLNLQLAEASVLSNLEKFLRWLMANITLQLGINSKIDEYWDLDLGTKISCTNYFQKHVLAQLAHPLVLALDEVNHLFEYPEIAQEFLPLLRFWHEEANNTDIWRNLRIIVVHSTEVYIPLDINQSPFNLGLPIILPEFNLEQVKGLALRHQLNYEPVKLEQTLEALMNMVGGFPYLIRLALYTLATQDITIEQLLLEAPTPSGIYRTHLQGYFNIFNQHPELMNTYSKIVRKEEPLQISSIMSYRLTSMGLVKLFGDKVAPSCLLYRLYFRDYLRV